MERIDRERYDNDAGDEPKRFDIAAVANGILVNSRNNVGGSDVDEESGNEAE